VGGASSLPLLCELATSGLDARASHGASVVSTVVLGPVVVVTIEVANVVVVDGGSVVVVVDGAVVVVATVVAGVVVVVVVTVVGRGAVVVVVARAVVVVACVAMGRGALVDTWPMDAGEVMGPSAMVVDGESLPNASSRPSDGMTVVVVLTVLVLELVLGRWPSSGGGSALARMNRATMETSAAVPRVAPDSAVVMVVDGIDRP